MLFLSHGLKRLSHARDPDVLPLGEEAGELAGDGEPGELAGEFGGLAGVPIQCEMTEMLAYLRQEHSRLEMVRVPYWLG
jgi:hypothetical protein